MNKKVVMIEESLYEFSKRGRKPKIAPRNIDTTDTFQVPEDDEEDDEAGDEVIDTVDVSDMTNAEEISVEDDVFDNKLLNALNIEVKLSEINRKIFKFRLKGQFNKIIYGLPMIKLGGNAFVFKLNDGSMKKIKVADMVLLEGRKSKFNRAKMVNEDFIDDWEKNEIENERYNRAQERDYPIRYDTEDNDQGDPQYELTDGRTIIMHEKSFPGMAGEPMNVHVFYDIEADDEKPLSYRDIKDFLNDEDRQEIREVLDDDAQSNEDSAISWVK